MIALERRRLLEAAAGALLISALGSRRAWGQGRPAVLEAWEAKLTEMNAQVRSGQLAPSDWIAEVQKLNGSVPVQDLARYIGFDAAVGGFTYPTAFPQFAAVTLPGGHGGPAAKPAWTTRIVAVRKGAHALPHLHDHWVEAHVVMSGSFRIRTYDRLRDLPDAVVLRPVRDDVAGVGGQILTSDERENCHWFTALEDRSISFYVSVMDVPPQSGGVHIDHDFVDPTTPPQGDGLIQAPTLTFAAARAKFDA